MYFKKLVMLGVTALSLGTTGVALAQPQTAEASTHSISRSWRGHYSGPQHLTLSAHYLKLGGVKSHVKYITKSSHGYHCIHFSNEQPLWLKHGYNKIYLHYGVGGSTDVYYR